MTIQKDGNSFTGTVFCGKLNAVLELEAEGVSEDYVRSCAESVEHMSDALFDAICEAVNKYCLWFNALEREAQGDSYTAAEPYQKITADTPARDLLPMFDFGTLYVDETEDESTLYFRLGGNCDWEPEHGIEAAFQGGTLRYLGSYDGVSQSELDYYITGEGREWNCAL